MSQMDPRDQLMQLRAMTVRTGMIHEAQRLQFTNWPKLVPGVSLKASDTKVKVDYERKIVTINCKAKGPGVFRATKSARRWVHKVAFWTTSILWPDTKVVFKVDGNVVEPLEDSPEESSGEQ